ncbi:MAG: sugar nucleotide-binding protein [Candidatus Marinimicrobia bacterium]|nr:sugar nucleotide-binding protein [Candidatus Neomarinimicrobiota bacterium]
MEINPDQVLLTGGNGLLGTEFRKQEPKLLATDLEEFDVTDPEQMADYLAERNITTILHAAAFTSPPKIDADPVQALQANIIGTANIATLCIERQFRLVYISTDYVFQGDRGNYRENDELLPQNRYAWSKLGGECAVRLHRDTLIIRTSFCEPVFPYPKAFIDQYTSRDSVTVIAPLILKLALMKDLTGIIHVGTERKSVMDLARKLGKTDVGDLKRTDVTFAVPFDTSFDLTKLNRILTKE